jgi:type II secretory ATPase GspE/PulE/Tfp pilus assembly ATPase PilB-like protein
MFLGRAGMPVIHPSSDLLNEHSDIDAYERLAQMAELKSLLEQGQKDVAQGLVSKAEDVFADLEYA